MNNKYLLSLLLAFTNFSPIVSMTVTAEKRINVTLHNIDPRKTILYALIPDEKFIPEAGDNLLSHLTEKEVTTAGRLSFKMPERSAIEIITNDGLYFVRRSYNHLSISKKPFLEANRTSFPSIASKEINQNPVDIFYRGADNIEIAQMPSLQ